MAAVQAPAVDEAHSCSGRRAGASIHAGVSIMRRHTCSPSECNSAQATCAHSGSDGANTPSRKARRTAGQNVVALCSGSLYARASDPAFENCCDAVSRDRSTLPSAAAPILPTSRRCLPRRQLLLEPHPRVHIHADSIVHLFHPRVVESDMQQSTAIVVPGLASQLATSHGSGPVPA